MNIDQTPPEHPHYSEKGQQMANAEIASMHEFGCTIVNRLNEIERFNMILGFLDKAVDPALEVKMLKEEAEEYFEACERNNQHGIMDALGDLMVVLWGTILKHGLKDKFWPDIMRLVNQSNFTKFCQTEEEAVQSCGQYNEQGIKVHYEYNCLFNVYVVRRIDGKGLKSINFKEPDFTGV